MTGLKLTCPSKINRLKPGLSENYHFLRWLPSPEYCHCNKEIQGRDREMKGRRVTVRICTRRTTLLSECLYGVYTVYIWCLYGIHKVFIKRLYGVYMAFIRRLYMGFIYRVYTVNCTIYVKR